MDEVLSITLSESTQEETKKQSFKPEGAKESEPILSSTDISQVESKNSELYAREEINRGMNGQIDADSVPHLVCESPNVSEQLQHKTYSPTLIESAFKVMKNLFSPDKAKSKSANIISPVKPKSASGSPSSSIYIPRKPEFAASESGIENLLSAQTGESSMKNQLNMNQIGVLYSPLTVESHNNTDESFLTTVSIIDDSFHSAITNLDENGETVKLDSNLMENFLNNSQNLGVNDPCNETLENSDYCLENTTLRNGSFALEATKVADVSVLSKEGSGEYSTSSHINGIQNEKCVIHSLKVPPNEIQDEIKEYDNTIQKADDLKSAENPEKDNSNDDNAEVVRPVESSDVNVQAKTHQKSNNRVKNVNMENIFLNKSFNAPINDSDSIEIFSKISNNNLENGSEATEGEKKRIDVNSCYQLNNEIGFGISHDERDVCLENTISTTTVVLNSADSVDLDQFSMSLEDITNANTVAPEISSAGSMPGNITGRQFLNEFDDIQNNKPFPKHGLGCEGNSSSVQKPQKNKSSISEKEPPGNASNFNKSKLHKSDEVVNKFRASSESPEGRRTLCIKKSSLDMSLIKNTEASKSSSPEILLERKADFDTLELSAPGKCFKNPNNSKLDELVLADKPMPISVISQQSYTVLNTDKNLNRPIIESIKVDEDSPEKHSFQTVDLRSKASAETPNPDKSTSNYCNASLGAAHSATPSHQKQSTPLWKGSGRDSQSEDVRTPAKPINLTSPRSPIHEGKREAEDTSKPDSLGIIHLNEDPAEFSPVNPINENELIFSNSFECEAGGEIRTESSKEPNEQGSAKKSGSKSKRLSETAETVFTLNQTFDKKCGTPQPHKLNQTFEKKPKSLVSGKTGHSSKDSSGCGKLNVTFNKSASTPSTNMSNKTYIKKTESLGIERSDETFVVSESPEGNEMNHTYNKNRISKEANQTYDLKGDSPESQNLNETFAQKSANETISLTEKSGSLLPNVENQTFVKDKQVESGQQKNVQDTTVEGNPGTEANEFPKNVEPETQAKEEGSPPAVDQQSSDHTDGCHRDLNGSLPSGRSSTTSVVGNDIATLLIEEGSLSRNPSVDDLAGKLGKLELSENSGSKHVSSEGKHCTDIPMIGEQSEEKNAFSDSVSPLDEKFQCDPYLVQLIQEQFSTNEIEKICTVVDDISAMKLSSQILKASEQFDKSIHESFSIGELKPPDSEMKSDEPVNSLSPKSFEFLSSIQGKPTGRDLSRESLYVKFDPLVQPNPNSLIDFTKEGRALPAEEKSPPTTEDPNVCERLLSISPQKKPDDIVPPLTPLSHKSKDRTEKLKELQNEIYFLKNLYTERERANRAKMDDYESQVAKLTGESCFLQDRLKEANEREKSLVKKMKEQTQSLNQLKIIMEEYVKVISKLTAELETLKAENQKQIAVLSTEKDSYMTHLQNTEAAFTDVHAKYEKSKKTIVSLKANEVMYRNTIAEQSQKMEDFKTRAKEAQEKAMKKFEKVQEELDEMKAGHSQESARLRAQLRKTELKVEALQESLEQKIKENQQLTAICDELIEGKK